MNKYHAHFTLANNCELIAPKDFKRTEIFLQDRFQVQHDVMLTKYYGGKSFSEQGQMVEEVLQDAKRFGNLLRVKLEYQGDDVHEAFTLHHENYVEAHVKVQTDSPEELFEFAKTIDGVRSRNPKSEGLYFVNFRVYGQEYSCAKDAIDGEIALIKEFGEVQPNPHVEVAIFDSNLAHDAWWA